MAPTKIRHAWLRDALMDRGYQQKDLAKWWKVDNAVVSRFVRTGEPELTWDRAQVLCEKLGLTMDDLRIRLAERPIPAPAREPAAPVRSSGPAHTGVEPTSVLHELHACVKRAREALPGWKIHLTIEPNGNGNGGNEVGSAGNPMRVGWVRGDCQ